MPTIQLTVRPCDTGKTVETFLVTPSGVAERVATLTANQGTAINAFLDLVKSGGDTAVAEAAMTVENMNTDQADALELYFAEINAETDTTSVETAINAL